MPLSGALHEPVLQIGSDRTYEVHEQPVVQVETKQLPKCPVTTPQSHSC